MHIQPLNETQAGYDSEPLNRITDHEGFQTSQRNLEKAGNQTAQRNPVPDHSTEPSGSPRNIATLEEEDMKQVLKIQKLNETKNGIMIRYVNKS
ncbi:hypothetical protein ACFXTH_025390 [Malus domestica]